MNIVVEKDEFIAGIYRGRYYDNDFGGKNDYYATYTVTNKRLFIEYGYFTQDNKRSIYFKDVFEIKDRLISKSFIIKENKLASNGWVYKIKHSITITGSFSKDNEIVKANILAFKEEFC